MKKCEPYVEPLRIYLAAPLFTPHQTNVISQVKPLMEECGFEVFSPLAESKDIWKGRPPAECGSEERKAVMQMNKEGIDSSDIIFAWLGGWSPWRAVADQQKLYMGDNPIKFSNEFLQSNIPSLPDTGVVWEMGYANSIGIPTLAYLHEGEEGRSFNLMLSETVDAVARGPKELSDVLVKMRPSIKSWAEELRAVEAEIDLQSEGAEFNG